MQASVQQPKQQTTALTIPSSSHVPTLDPGTHRTLVNSKVTLLIYLTFPPFHESTLCCFSSLFTDFTIFVDFFLLSQIFNFLSIYLFYGFSKNGSLQVLRPGALGRPRGIGWRGRWEGDQDGIYM